MTTHDIPERFDFARTAPRVFKAVFTLDAAARDGLDPVVVELVQIRASQINGCAYCLDFHTTNARKAGEQEQRIYQLNGWHESSLFTRRERAALALTEQLTVLAGGVDDEVYADAELYFTSEELAKLVGVIFTVNAWNRMNIATRKTPGTE